jgi:hypothetical protein
LDTGATPLMSSIFRQIAKTACLIMLPHSLLDFPSVFKQHLAKTCIYIKEKGHRASIVLWHAMARRRCSTVIRRGSIKREAASSFRTWARHDRSLPTVRRIGREGMDARLLDPDVLVVA